MAWRSTISSVAGSRLVAGDAHRRVRRVVQVGAERALAEVRVLAGAQDELVPGDVDDLRRHADHAVVGVEAGDEPGVEAFEGAQRGGAVAELVLELGDEVRRVLVALDELAPAVAGEGLHGAHGRGGSPRVTAPLGGGFPTLPPARAARAARPARRPVAACPAGRRSRAARMRASIRSGESASSTGAGTAVTSEDVAAAIAAAPSAAPLSKRSAGSFASARASTASKPGTAGGGSDRCAHSFGSVPSTSNTGRPVNATYSRQPSEYRSAAGPSPAPRMRSGAM